MQVRGLERAVALELTLAAQDLSAHARLLVEALEGDPALSIRGDEAEECWRIVEPILGHWEADGPPLLDLRGGLHRTRLAPHDEHEEGAPVT